MTPNLKTVYGLIMLSSNADGADIYSRINPEWNLTPFYERLYEAFGSILEQEKVVDPIEVVQYFRGKGWSDKKLVLQISDLTRNVSLGSQVYLNSILTEIERAYQIFKARQTSQKISELIESENFTEDKYAEILSAGSIEKKDRQKIESNIDTIFQIVDDHNKSKAGELPGIDLGWRTFSGEIILEPVDLMVVGARPAMGKTAFAVSVTINLAFKKRLKVAFFSLEMSRKQIMRRMVANLAVIDSQRIKLGECSSAEIDRIYKVQEFEELNNITIFEGSHSVRDITQKVAELKRQEAVDIVVIDYLQKILPKRSGSRYEQVTEVSNGVKMLSQNLKIPTIALAQLSRSGAQIGKLPTLTDLKESGEIEQDASIVCFLHRPEYYGEDMTSNGNPAQNVCEVLIAKNREGSVGKYELSVDLSLSKFYE